MGYSLVYGLDHEATAIWALNVLTKACSHVTRVLLELHDLLELRTVLVMALDKGLISKLKNLAVLFEWYTTTTHRALLVISDLFVR